MLTAWDKSRDIPIALPDFEEAGALRDVRDRARAGELLCPVCRQLLWLRAGQVRIPHFAHRSLSDCPHGRVSEAVLGARRLLYKFFQARIESGKLAAEIILEPAIEGLPRKLRIDLLLRRAEKPSVHVLLLDRGCKPEIRDQLRDFFHKRGGLLRPVFLSDRLKVVDGDPTHFLLDTTQRAFRLRSDYDLRASDQRPEPGTLHSIDPGSGRWTTLRGLSLDHEPQDFAADHILVSTMDQLLWSEGRGEWVHPGEAEALKVLQAEREARKQREAKALQERKETERQRQELRRQAQQRAEERIRAIQQHITRAFHEQSPVQPQPDPAPLSQPGHVSETEHAPPELDADVHEPGEDDLPPPPEPLPTWIMSGLVCVGCGQRTTAWQNAEPATDACVCRDCFKKGIRLHQKSPAKP